MHKIAEQTLIQEKTKLSSHSEFNTVSNIHLAEFDLSGITLEMIDEQIEDLFDDIKNGIGRDYDEELIELARQVLEFNPTAFRRFL